MVRDTAAVEDRQWGNNNTDIKYITWGKPTVQVVVFMFLFLATLVDGQMGRATSGWEEGRRTDPY